MPLSSVLYTVPHTAISTAQKPDPTDESGTAARVHRILLSIKHWNYVPRSTYKPVVTWICLSFSLFPFEFFLFDLALSWLDFSWALYLLVELEETHPIFARDEGSPNSIHRRMYNTFESQGVDYRSRYEYGAPDLFVGLSLTVKDVNRLNNMPGVKAVRAVEHFAVPHSPIIVSRSKSVSMFAAFSADPNSEPASDILHALTGVDKLHDEGITGKGIKIAIIDTGVDYNYPALGAGFGPGHKIAGGFDFTGDNLEKIKPDEDPMDCNGHGTHVAGIIGANLDDSPFKLQGVAYEAELYAYRVGGCADSVDEDATIAALLRADKDGCDVINLSVGATSGWSAGHSWTIVANRIAEKGRILTISAWLLAWQLSSGSGRGHCCWER
ncbi:hypothetical protein PM082_021860 [Marasmius tenuissimus]|nr:hypothetical protein PM082_021860 [Marasmius tenuissimus]